MANPRTYTVQLTPAERAVLILALEDRADRLQGRSDSAASEEIEALLERVASIDPEVRHG